MCAPCEVPGSRRAPRRGQVRRQVIATLGFLRNSRRTAGLSSRGVRLRTSGAAPYPKIRKCSATPSARRRFSLPISHLGNGGVEDGQECLEPSRYDDPFEYERSII